MIRHVLCLMQENSIPILYYTTDLQACDILLTENVLVIFKPHVHFVMFNQCV